MSVNVWLRVADFDSLQARDCSVRQTVQTGSGTHVGSYAMGMLISWRQSGRSENLPRNLHLGLRLRERLVLPLYPLYISDVVRRLMPRLYC